MHLTSPAFHKNGSIPRRFSCEGENISFELNWEDSPKGTKSFVVIVHDPDAPRENGFTHWVLFNIPPNTTRIRENIPKRGKVEGVGTQGANDSGEIGYIGPCPPSGVHRYVVHLYALRKELDLAPGNTAEKVKAAMENYIIEHAELTGKFAKALVSRA